LIAVTLIFQPSVKRFSQGSHRAGIHRFTSYSRGPGQPNSPRFSSCSTGSLRTHFPLFRDSLSPPSRVRKAVHFVLTAAVAESAMPPRSDVGKTGSLRTHSRAARAGRRFTSSSSPGHNVLQIGTVRAKNRVRTYSEAVHYVLRGRFTSFSSPVHFVLFTGSLCPRNVHASIENYRFFGR
jgi:hypothetical protein